MSQPDMERFTPSLKGRMAYEHLHRYALCRDYVAGLDVLDVGCGEGYGTAILGAVAAHVTGLDIDAQTVRTAQARYGIKGRVSFREGDSRKTPFADASFDAVVAMETIEHIEQPERLIAEARRILRPGGLFIVSTPNREIYNRYKSPNPFHIKEMSHGEFADALAQHFSFIELFGQRMAVVSTLSPTVPPPLPSNWPGYRGYTAAPGSAGQSGVDALPVRLEEPEYLVAVCSDAAIAHPVEGHSVFLSNADDLWREHEKVLAWASGLHEEDEVLRRHVQELTAREASARGAVDSQVQALAAAASDRHRLQGQLDNYSRQIETQTQSFEMLNSVNRALQERLAQNSEAAQAFGGQGMRMVGALISRASGVAVSDDPLSLFDGLAALMQDRASDGAKLDLIRRDLQDALGARDTALARAVEAERLGVEERAAREAETARALQSGAALATLRNEIAQRVQAEALLGERLTSSVAERQAIEARMAAEAEALQDEIARLAAQVEAQTADGEARERVLMEAVSAAADELKSVRDAQMTYAAESRVALEARMAAEAQEWAAERTRLVAQAQTQVIERDARVRALMEALAAAEAGLSEARMAGAETETVRQHSRDLAEKLAALEAQAASVPPQRAEFTPAISPEEAARLRALSDQADRLKLVASRALREATAAARVIAQQSEDAERQQQAIAEGLGEALPFASRAEPEFAPGVSRVGRLIARLRRVPTISSLVTQGDLANRQRNWPSAEASYAAALRRDPALAAIWVQYGHALKEQGRRQAAEIAYRRAIALEPANYDTHIQLGHVLKTGGRLAASYASYARALELAPDNADAKRELKTLPAPVGPIGERELSSIANELTAALSGTTQTRAMPPVRSRRPALWPPASVRDYWIPQRMRDYLGDTHGGSIVALCQYLFSVVAHYGDGGAAFEPSGEYEALLERAQALSLIARAETPAVSIIVPVYNNLVFTLTSIVSVLEFAGETSFEIIVGDDGSSDATPQAIRAIGGAVRLVRHDRNLGFLHNCNEAARAARGAHLVFLNNDTIVLPGWLDALIAPFRQFADAGITGSKLLNGDGSLQEAGGIFWRDGSAWNYGRNGDPALPEFNYLRRTDYCSGASIAIPAPLWRQLRGFDPEFAPAYCEDSDLAFRVRAAGYEVYYQPQSELVHHEGRSHGRDVTTGVKAHQVINQQKLLTRWRQTLEAENFESGSDLILARDRSRSRPHIVVIDHYVPQWDRDAGSRTMFDYLKLLASSGFQVSFWPDNLNYDKAYASVLQGLGIEVIYSSRYAGRFDEWFDSRARYVDFALFSRPHITANYLDAVMRHKHVYRLYYGHDLHFKRMQDQRAVDPLSIEAGDIDAMKAIEIAVWRKCDVVMYPSESEAVFVRESLGDPLAARAIPMLAFDAADLAARRVLLDEQFAARRLTEMVFVGGFSHRPNIDAVVWFAHRVMPLLRALGHGYTLSIVGSNAPEAITDLAGGDIAYLGRVSDDELKGLYAKAGFAVVPLRFGGGVKGKVIEAMANGVPLIMTGVGAQGIPDAAGLAVVEDDAAAMAEAIIAGTQNPAMLLARTKRALDFISTFYSRDAAKAAFGIDALLNKARDARRL